MKKYIYALLFFFACTNSVWAVEKVSAAQQDGLKLEVFASENDPVAEWKQPKHPAFKRITSTKVNTPFYVAVLASGMRMDDKNNYKGMTQLKILRPDGSILFTDQDRYFQGSVSEKYKDYVGTFIMVEPSLVIGMESSDPKGTYVIECILQDVLGKRQTKTSYKLTLE